MKRKQRRAPVTEFQMPVRLPPLQAFGNRLPGKGEWADDSDLSVIVDPMERILAWQYAYFRLRLDGKEPSLIRVLRERYKRDEAFRTNLISVFRQSSPDEFSSLRCQLLEGSSRPIKTQPMVITNPPLTKNLSNPVVETLIKNEAPSLQKQLQDIQQELIAEKAARIAAEQEAKEQRIKRLHADAARDDAFQELANEKALRLEAARRIRELTQKIKPLPVVQEVRPKPATIKAPEISGGERIRALRIRQGLTQVELGGLIGVSGATISLLERNMSNSYEERLKDIAKALRVPFQKLKGGI